MVTAKPWKETCYFAERYCVFCQNDLPESKIPSRPPDRSNFFDWELDVIGLFNLVADSSPAPQVYVFRTNLADLSFIYDPPLILKNRQGDVRAIRADRKPEWSSQCDVNRPLLFAHICCWKVARQLHPNRSSLEFYRLMRQLHPIVPRTHRAKEELCNLASILNLGPTRDTTKTNLSYVLSRSARLPQELQRLVLRNLAPGSLIFCLLATFQSAALVSELSSPLSMPIYFHENLVPKGFVGTGWLHATHISIFGHTYLRRIRISGCQDEHGTFGLEIDAQSVRGLGFVVGALGVSAIRLVYHDSSVSSWLGNPGKGWHGSTFGFHMDDLQIWQDDLKVLSFRFPDASGKKLTAPPSRAFWDVIPNQYVPGNSHIAQMYPSPGQLMHYPGWRLCRYLPFQYDNHLATGITIYNDAKGTNQIVVHGRHHEYGAAACDRGCPTYFHLNDGEKIVRLGLVRVGDSVLQCGPFLLIETKGKTLHRSAFFGPIALLSNPKAEWLSLIPAQVNKKRCVIKGLIVDILTATDSHLNTIGAYTIPDEEPITNETTPLRPFVIPAFRTPPRLLIFNGLAFQTTAELSNVKRLGIQTRYVTDFEGLQRPRSSGLCIYHNDGSIETLGQWDGSSTTDSKIIYNAEVDGSIEAVIFRYRRGKMWDERPETRHYLVDIRVKSSRCADVEDNQEEGHHEHSPLHKPAFHWQASGQKFIAWWFTSYFDHVGQWDSTMVEFHPSRQSGCEYQLVE